MLIGKKNGKSKNRKQFTTVSMNSGSAGEKTKTNGPLFISPEQTTQTLMNQWSDSEKDSFIRAPFKGIHSSKMYISLKDVKIIVNQL